MAKSKKAKAVAQAPRNRAVKTPSARRKAPKAPDGNTPVDAQSEIGERARLRPIDQA